jgi:hypothetical protein
MKNKFRFTFFLFAISLISFSQERFGSTEKALNKFKKLTMQVCTNGANAEIEETLKSAFEKYWNFCPVEFIDYKNVDKDKPTLLLSDYEINSWTHYTFTEMSFTNTVWSHYNCHFDNLTVKNECLGIDNTNEAFKYKINLAVLSFAAQVKFLDNAFTENKTKGLNSWEGFKERLKTTTILIPKEYLSNGLTKNAFKKIGKYEIVPLADIAKRLAENNTKGYSVLNTYKSIIGSFFNIIDLETGDYIFRHDFGSAFEKGMIGSPGKISDKEIIKIIDKMIE